MTFYQLERKQVFAIKQMGGAIHVLSCRKVHVMISGPSLNCLVSCLSPIIIFGWSRREWLGLRAGRDLRDFPSAQRSPASSVLAREGAGCGSVGDVPGATSLNQA